MKMCLCMALMMIGLESGAAGDVRFGDSSARWNVMSRFLCNAAKCEYLTTLVHEVKEDTVIDGKSYQSISVPPEPAFYFPMYLGEKVFVRQDSAERVFFRRYADTMDYVIYDFSKQPGDTMTVDNPLFWNIAYVTIDSLDTLLLDKPRKRLFVRYNANPERDEWIEGIGSVKSYFLQPGVNFIASHVPDFQTLCFAENESTIFQNPVYNTCIVDTLWNGVEDIREAVLTVYPNPASNYLGIQLASTSSQEAHFLLMDINGRLIVNQPLRETTERLDVSSLGSGMYFYSVVTDKEKLGAGKVVIE